MLFDKVLKQIFIILIAILLISQVAAYSIEQLKEDNKDYFDFDIYLDYSEISMQPNNQDRITLYVIPKTNQELRFEIYSEDYPFLKAEIQPFAKGYTNFKKTVYIQNYNAQPGNYNLKFNVSATNGKEIIQKDIILKVIITEKQEFAYNTSLHTNDMPNISTNDFSTRNLLIDNNSSESISFKVSNTGSTSSFKLDYYPKVEGLEVEFIEENITIIKDETKSIIVKINIDEHFDNELVKINFTADEKLTRKQFYLGNVNVHLSNPVIEMTYENGILKLKNEGTASAYLKVFLDDSSEIVYIASNNMKIIDTKGASKITIYREDEKLGTFTNNTQEELENENKGMVTGFFTLSNLDNGNIALIVFIMILIGSIYWIFFKKNGILNNSVSAKEIGMDSN
jgi:hypothetical protein